MSYSDPVPWDTTTTVPAGWAPIPAAPKSFGGPGDAPATVVVTSEGCCCGGGANPCQCTGGPVVSYSLGGVWPLPAMPDAQRAVGTGCCAMPFHTPFEPQDGTVAEAIAQYPMEVFASVSDCGFLYTSRSLVAPCPPCGVYSAVWAPNAYHAQVHFYRTATTAYLGISWAHRVLTNGGYGFVYVAHHQEATITLTEGESCCETLTFELSGGLSYWWWGIVTAAVPPWADARTVTVNPSCLIGDPDDPGGGGEGFASMTHDTPPALTPSIAEVTRRVRLPCIHLGDRLPGTSCGNKIHTCRLYGGRTRPAGPCPEAVRTCQGCPAYVPR